MMNLAIEAPWYTYGKQLIALFGPDPAITVGDVEESTTDDVDFFVNIEVSNHEKFIALDRVLPKVKTFGNITLGIYLYDEENATAGNDAIEQYKTIFKGNPLVSEIIEAEDMTGDSHGFIMFKPQVIQFYDDNLFDYNGNWSGLAQDIAKEVFEDEIRGIHFCTAPVEK